MLENSVDELPHLHYGDEQMLQLRRCLQRSQVAKVVVLNKFSFSINIHNNINLNRFANTIPYLSNGTSSSTNGSKSARNSFMYCTTARLYSMSEQDGS